jgi:ribosomal-protein-alanine acetyltransferase
MDFLIRNARESDINVILSIEKQCFSMPHTREQLVSCLDESMHVFPVAVREDGSVLGYVEMTVIVDEGYISNVAVAQPFRRQGIADSLLGYLINYGIESSLSFITLEVRESNDAAISLYKNHNFKIAGFQRNYYTEPKENAIIMTRYFN